MISRRFVIAVCFVLQASLASASAYNPGDAFTFQIQLNPIANTASVFNVDNTYSWAATDGVNLFDPLGADLHGSISIGADGAVSSWNFYVEILALPNPSIDTGYLVLSCGFSPCITSVLVSGLYAGDFAQTTNNALGDYLGISMTPGTWSANGDVYTYHGNQFDVLGAPPPEPPPSGLPLPAALPLFATGLGALGIFGWRRKRKAQAVAA